MHRKYILWLYISTLSVPELVLIDTVYGLRQYLKRQHSFSKLPSGIGYFNISKPVELRVKVDCNTAKNESGELINIDSPENSIAYVSPQSILEGLELQDKWKKNEKVYSFTSIDELLEAINQETTKNRKLLGQIDTESKKRKDIQERALYKGYWYGLEIAKDMIKGLQKTEHKVVDEQLKEIIKRLQELI